MKKPEIIDIFRNGFLDEREEKFQIERRFSHQIASAFATKDAPLVALGLHGCKGMSFADYDEFIFRCEMIILQPRKLLLYGKPTKAEKEILDDIGIPYRVYPDFQTLYKRGGSQDD